MRITIIVIIVLLTSCGVSAATGVDLLVVDATLFDARTGRAMPDAAVTVVGGIISDVGSTDELGGTEAARVIDAKGKLLVPGLIDAHGHLIDVLATSFTPGGGGEADLVMDADSIAVYRRSFADAYLPHGVTTVRDAGTNDDYMPLLQALMERDPGSPDFYPCGGALVSHEEGRVPYSGHREIHGEEGARDVVRAYHDAGFGHVKLYWRLRGSDFRAALDEALRLEMVPFAHVDRGVVTIGEALDAGLRHFEHAFTLGVEVLGGEQVMSITVHAIRDVLGGDRRGAWFMATTECFSRIGEGNASMRRLIGRLADEGATVTPTLHAVARPLGLGYAEERSIGSFDDTSAWSEDQLERARNGYAVLESCVAAMHEAGVQLALGTDAIDPGAAALSELLLLHDAGIPMADVLCIGTLGSAVTIELSDNYGTIEPGKRANLVLFDEDPLDDPGALLGEKLVVKDGVVYERGAEG
jgi:imidazolonepropionase-like amidohydrolase